jgi:hypothetical protein
LEELRTGTKITLTIRSELDESESPFLGAQKHVYEIVEVSKSPSGKIDAI